MTTNDYNISSPKRRKLEDVTEDVTESQILSNVKIVIQIALKRIQILCSSAGDLAAPAVPYGCSTRCRDVQRRVCGTAVLDSFGAEVSDVQMHRMYCLYSEHLWTIFEPS